MHLAVRRHAVAVLDRFRRKPLFIIRIKGGIMHVRQGLEPCESIGCAGAFARHDQSVAGIVRFGGCKRRQHRPGIQCVQPDLRRAGRGQEPDGKKQSKQSVIHKKHFPYLLSIREVFPDL